MRVRNYLLALALTLVLLTAPALAADHGEHTADDGWTALTADVLFTGKYYLDGNVTVNTPITSPAPSPSASTATC